MTLRFLSVRCIGYGFQSIQDFFMFYKYIVRGMIDNLNDYDWMPEMSKFLYEMNPNYVPSYADNLTADEQIEHQRNLQNHGKVTSYLATQAIAPGEFDEDGPGEAPDNWRRPVHDLPEYIDPHDGGVPPPTGPRPNNNNNNGGGFDLPVDQGGKSDKPDDNDDDDDDGGGNQGPRVKPEPRFRPSSNNPGGRPNWAGPNNNNQPPAPPGPPATGGDRFNLATQTDRGGGDDDSGSQGQTTLSTTTSSGGDPGQIEIQRNGELADRARGDLAERAGELDPKYRSIIQRGTFHPPPAIRNTDVRVAGPAMEILGINQGIQQIIPIATPEDLAELIDQNNEKILDEMRGLTGELAGALATTLAEMPTPAATNFDDLQKFAGILSDKLSKPLQDAANTLAAQNTRFQEMERLLKENNDRSDKNLERAIGKVNEKLDGVRTDLKGVTDALGKQSAPDIPALNNAIRDLSTAVKGIRTPDDFKDTLNGIRDALTGLRNIEVKAPPVDMKPFVDELGKLRQTLANMPAPNVTVNAPDNTAAIAGEIAGLRNDIANAPQPQVNVTTPDNSQALNEVAAVLNQFNGALGGLNERVGQLQNQLNIMQSNPVINENADIQGLKDQLANTQGQLVNLQNQIANNQNTDKEALNAALSRLEGLANEVRIQNETQAGIIQTATQNIQGQITDLAQKTEQNLNLPKPPQEEEKKFEYDFNKPLTSPKAKIRVRNNENTSQTPVLAASKGEAPAKKSKRRLAKPLKNNTNVMKAAADQANGPEAPAPEAEEPIPEKPNVDELWDPNKEGPVVQDIAQSVTNSEIQGKPADEKINPVHSVMNAITRGMEVVDATKQSAMRSLSGMGRALTAGFKRIKVLESIDLAKSLAHSFIPSVQDKWMQHASEQAAAYKAAQEKIQAGIVNAKSVVDGNIEAATNIDAARDSIMPRESRKRKFVEDPVIDSFTDVLHTREEVEAMKATSLAEARNKLDDLEAKLEIERQKPLITTVESAEDMTDAIPVDNPLIPELAQQIVDQKEEVKRLRQEAKLSTESVENARKAQAKLRDKGALGQMEANAALMEVVSDQAFQQPTGQVVERLEDLKPMAPEDLVPPASPEEMQRLGGLMQTIRGMGIRTTADVERLKTQLKNVRDTFAEAVDTEQMSVSQVQQFLAEQSAVLQEVVQETVAEGAVTKEDGHYQIEAVRALATAVKENTQAAEEFAQSLKNRMEFTNHVYEKNKADLQKTFKQMALVFVGGKVDEMNNMKRAMAQGDTPFDKVLTGVINNYMSEWQANFVAKEQATKGRVDVNHRVSVEWMANQISQRLHQHSGNVKIGLVNQFIDEAKHLRENPQFTQGKELDEKEKEDYILAIAREADDSLGFTTARLEALFYKGLSDAVTIMDGFSKITGVGPMDKNAALQQSVTELRQGPANREDEFEGTQKVQRQLEGDEKLLESVGKRNNEFKLLNNYHTKANEKWKEFEQKNPEKASEMDAQAQASFVNLKGIKEGTYEWQKVVIDYLSKGYLTHRAKYNIDVPSLSELVGVKMGGMDTVYKKLAAPDEWWKQPGTRAKINEAVKKVIKVIDLGEKKNKPLAGNGSSIKQIKKSNVK